MAKSLELIDQPGWHRFSKYQKGFLERLPYVTNDQAAYEHVGKKWRWLHFSKLNSPNFKNAIDWVKTSLPRIPTYDEEVLALEAEHYLVQVLRDQVKGDPHRISVAKDLRTRKKGRGKGGRQIFRATDEEGPGLTGLPRDFTENGAGE